MIQYKNTIDLTNKSRGGIKYEIINFNDGEPHIKIKEFDRKMTKPLTVICRITNPSDLFILMQVGDILNRQGVLWELIIPYLMGARMDRVFNMNEAFSLSIVASVIKGLKPKHIYLIEGHSKRAYSELNASEFRRMFDYPNEHGDVYCFPDQGAAERYPIGWGVSITFDKVRDPDSGKITDMTINKHAFVGRSSIIVRDDLCDYGTTFVEVAKILRAEHPNAKLKLQITHAVCLEGLIRVAKAYDEVLIYNTYKDYTRADLPENVLMLDWRTKI